MKKSEIYAWRAEHEGDENPYLVIAHARRARKRGHQPSMPYRGERNPRRALHSALHDVGVAKDVRLHDRTVESLMLEIVRLAIGHGRTVTDLLRSYTNLYWMRRLNVDERALCAALEGWMR